MKARAWMWVTILVAVFAAVAALGCSHDASARFASVKGGDMPEGESWVGVYYNPVYGYLHLIEQDGNIVGRWRRTDGSHWGELSGTAEGNVVRFTWKEHAVGGVGPSAESAGAGAFVYKIGSDGIPELGGQYAMDQSRNIGDWHCVKQVGMKPDLNSVGGQATDNMGVTPENWK